MFRSSNTQGQNNSKGKWGKRTRAVAFCGGLFMVGGIAAAAWTGHGEFHAPGSTAVVQSLNTSGVVVDALWPGDCNDVQVTVANPNPRAVKITNLANQGFSGVSDTAASADGNANRLEDFLYQADVSGALNGHVIDAGDTKTFTVKNAVCLHGNAPSPDDARQGQTFKADYFVAVEVVAGNESS